MISYVIVGTLADLFCLMLLQTNFFIVAVQVFLVYLSYYCIHRFVLHNMSFNPHVYVHHYKYFQVHRYVELGIDFLFEMFSFAVVPLLLQYWLNIWIVPPTIVILITLFLSFGHLFNYSLLGSDIHKAHHTDSTTNFGPDFMDHLLGTNASPEYEDTLQHIPALVQACIVTHFAKAYFQWKD